MVCVVIFAVGGLHYVMLVLNVFSSRFKRQKHVALFTKSNSVTKTMKGALVRPTFADDKLLMFNDILSLSNNNNNNNGSSESFLRRSPSDDCQLVHFRSISAHQSTHSTHFNGSTHNNANVSLHYFCILFF
jgi:hypothetical protein